MTQFNKIKYFRKQWHMRYQNTDLYLATLTRHTPKKCATPHTFLLSIFSSSSDLVLLLLIGLWSEKGSLLLANLPEKGLYLAYFELEDSWGCDHCPILICDQDIQIVLLWCGWWHWRSDASLLHGCSSLWFERASCCSHCWSFSLLLCLAPRLLIRVS